MGPISNQLLLVYALTWLALGCPLQKSESIEAADQFTKLLRSLVDRVHDRHKQ